MTDELFEFTEDSQWESLVDKAKIPVVVEFYTPWCEPCKELEPVLKKMSKEFPTVSFYRYNMDTLYYQANKREVTGVPTTILFKPGIYTDGPPMIADTIYGYITADMFRDKLQKLTAAEQAA
jgi:thiol-disulfide isomerase/thioredoxin